VILLIGLLVVAVSIVEKARARAEEAVRKCVFVVITTLWRNRRAKYKK